MTKSDRTRQAEEAEQAALAALTTLSVEQQNAIDLLVTGQGDAEVAAAVGVTRQTVCTWRGHHPGFQAALNARRAETWGRTVDRLRELLPRAVERLEAELDGPNGWRIALRLVEQAGLTQPQGISLGAVGATEAAAILDDILHARFDPVAHLGRYPVGDYERRQLVAELTARLATESDE
jgi:hypothetical protein